MLQHLQHHIITLVDINRINMQRNLSLELISETIKAIDKVGTERLLEVVKDVQRVSKTDKQLIDCIITTSCTYYKISKQTLMEGNDRSEGKRVNCLTVCFALIQKHANYNNQQISDYFGKHKSLISRYLKWFKNLDKKIPYENDLIYDHQEIATQTEILISKLAKNV